MLDDAGEAKGRLWKALYKGKKKKFIKTVKAIRKCAPNEKAVKDCEEYLLNNWDSAVRRMQDKNVYGCSAEGHVSHKPIHECDDEFVLKLWNTNYMSALLCARKFIPGMIERGNGNIINISSIHADMTMPGFGIYASTKGAMNAMGRAMALDYADNGIRVNNLSPGLILSDNVLDEVNSYKEGSERDNFVKMLKSMQPMEPGKMEDVANTALFLASDMSKYITGQTILVDGGASIKAH